MRLNTAASAIAISTALLAHTAAAQAEQMRFEIAAKPVSEALQDFAEQSGFQMAFLADAAAGVPARPVSGALEPEAALRRLLDGTGLEFRFIDERTIAILQKTAEAESGGAVLSTPVQYANAEQSQPRNPVQQVARAQAQGGQQRQSQAEGDDPQIEEIVVTGSRIARDRQFTPTPLSVVDRSDFDLSGTVNAEDLLNTLPQFVPAGTASSNIPGNGVATLDLRGLGPSRTLTLVNGRRWLFFDATQITDINTIPSALVERVEVVTGGSSAVYGSDAIAGVVNFILRDDFEGIELQTQQTFDSRTDGLTSDFNLTAGGNFADKRGNAVVSVNYLKREPIRNSDRDFAKFAFVDRVDDQGIPILLPGGSSAIPEGRFTGIPAGEALEKPGREGLQDALEAAGLGNITGSGFVPQPSPDGAVARPFKDPEDRFNYAPFNFLQTPQERWSITAKSQYELHEKVEGYVEASFSNNRVIRQQSPTPVRGDFLFEVDNPFLAPEVQNVLRELDKQEGVDGNPVKTVRAGTTTETTTPGDGLAVLNIFRRVVETGPRPIRDERNAWRAAFGVRGKLGDLSDSFLRNISYDAYYLFGRTENTREEGNLTSLSAFFDGLLSDGENDKPLLNPFGPNISEEGAESITRDAISAEISELQVAAGTFDAELFNMPGFFGSPSEPVFVSFGGEWRSTSGSFTPAQLLASGDVAGATAGKPTSGEVDVWELFTEIRVPLLQDLPLVEDLTANGAFRYSNYDLSTNSTVWTYLGGIEWQLNPAVSARGQFQRAIRAPNINELFSGQSQIFVFAQDPCSQPEAAEDPTVRTLCQQTGVPSELVGESSVQPTEQITALAGGNPDLEPEIADTWTIGAVFTPPNIPGLTVSVDYFDIKVSKAVGIAGGGVDSALNLCFNVIQDINSDTCQLIDRNPTNGVIQSPFFISATSANTGKIKVEGIDASIGYTWGAEFGLFSNNSQFQFDLTGSWTDKFTITPLQELPDEKNKCAGAFGATCGEPKAEFRFTNTLRWNTGPLTFRVRHRFIDAVKDDRVIVPGRAGDTAPSPETLFNHRFSTQNYLDFSFDYDAAGIVNVYGGVNNFTDNTPPLQGTNIQQANTFPSTFDVLGPEIFLGLRLRL